jgi:hypothetical protein
MPGGVTINYSTFKDDAQQEMDQIVEYINKQHSSDYFFTSNTV